MENLEKLYSPSQWSKRMPAEQLLKYHVEFLNKESENVRNQFKTELNKSYGHGEREKYDILGTDLPNDSPILVYLHGGYYQEESITHKNGHFIAKNLYKNKIKFITVGYELSPNKRLQEIFENLQKVLKICMEYARKCNSRGVYLAGHSVGAHALATLLPKFQESLANEDQQLIKAIFLIAGVYDFLPITKMSANETLQLTEAEAKNEFSPQHFQNEYQKFAKKFQKTKFYVIVGEFDSPAFVKQSEEFNKKLKNDGVKSEYFFIKNVDHFNIIENLYDETFEVTQIILNAIKCN